MIISYATVKIMKNIYGTFTKTLSVGTTTNYTQNNRAMGFARYKGETCDKTDYKFIKEKSNEKEIILCDTFYSSTYTYAIVRDS